MPTFTYNVTDEERAICETQVTDLDECLTSECERVIQMLKAGAAEAAARAHSESMTDTALLSHLRAAGLSRADQEPPLSPIAPRGQSR